MSHSIRQQLVAAQRFDIHVCASQIANIVVDKLFEAPTNIEESVYSYNGENIEFFLENEVTSIGERLEGEFFDAFPEIEIEVRVRIDDCPDVDGYYYHTLDPSEEDGLIEVIVSINRNFLKRITQARLENSIQSVLAHEMQHAVQRCYTGVDMAQIHNSPVDHLTDFREIDARVEEVLCGTHGMCLSASHFESKITAYIHEYCRRNGLVGIDIDQVVQQHTRFYEDKILNAI